MRGGFERHWSLIIWTLGKKGKAGGFEMPLKCCCLPLSFQLVVLALQLTCCCCGIVSEHGSPAQNPTYRLPRDFNYYTNWTKYMQSKTKYQWKEELFWWLFVRLVSHCTAVRTMPFCCSLADRCSVYQAGMMTVTVFIFFIPPCCNSKLVRFSATTLCFWVCYKWNCKKYACHLWFRLTGGKQWYHWCWTAYARCTVLADILHVYV